MPSPDRTSLAPRIRGVVNAMVALCAFVSVIGGIEARAVATAMPQATAYHHNAGTSANLTTGQKGVAVHGRKEGLLAIGHRRPVARREWPDRWRGPFG